jgi:hypothetical protein
VVANIVFQIKHSVMLNIPKTLIEAKKYRYNKWAGNPNGDKYNEKQCAYEVSDNRGFMYRQCTRKNGKGINGLYCGIHAKKI